MMKNAERVTGTKKMFREKRFLQKKRLLAVLLLTVLSICLVGGCGSKPVSTQDADILSSYIGFWRYEGTPTYVTINDQYQWATTDFYGNQLDSGVITTDENGLNLSRADGSFVSTLAVTDTGLVDGGGNTLVASEGLVFLPTAADALNQTIAFPGNFGNVTINYPAQMNAYPYVSYTDSLGFDALVKNGTDDYYTNIMIGFQPIAGYDDNMTKGLASAQPYLENMMQTLLQNMYGANMTQFIGANCIDGGDHYSIVGSMWMSSGIFGDGSSGSAAGKYGSPLLWTDRICHGDHGNRTGKPASELCGYCKQYADYLCLYCRMEYRTEGSTAGTAAGCKEI